MESEIKEVSQARLKSIRKLKLKKYRYQTHSFICEGYRLYTAAIKSSPLKISEVFLSVDFVNSFESTNVIKFCKGNNIPVFRCFERDFKSISDEKTPSGILFISTFRILNSDNLTDIKCKNCIYLENISDPGNLGTIIRTAAWYGIRDILLSSESVDPFNMKVVRATAGGIFFVNIFNNINSDTVEDFGNNNGYDLVSTVVNEGTPISNWKVSDKNIIFFGGEANGLTASTKKIINQATTIPGNGEMESLNLSITAGIVLNHLFSFQNKDL